MEEKIYYFDLIPFDYENNTITKLKVEFVKTLEYTTYVNIRYSFVNDNGDELDENNVTINGNELIVFLNTILKPYNSQVVNT